jgi:3,4-dihydroxy 2-butanone 4-phosphate synthase/GTP cyclohydrolase II
MNNSVEKIKNAIAELKLGKMIVLTDPKNREDEGDFVYPAQNINVEMINFMRVNGSGIICLALTETICQQLNLPLLVSDQENSNHFGTRFTMSIESKIGVTSGVSAQDRVTTILAAVNDKAVPADLLRPGHVFPLLAHKEGVLGRKGHTEGATDLMKIAGFKPAAVISEAMNADGTVMRGEALEKFVSQHNLCCISIDDIMTYRWVSENFIADSVNTTLPVVDIGTFALTAFKEKITGNDYLALSAKIPEDKPCLVRLHSSCATGDIFGSLRCDCGKQLKHALQKIQQEGGILIYLPQEGRGIGLFNKIKTYVLQDQGYDTVEANCQLGFEHDLRDYGFAAQILKYFNLKQVKLLTNNPKKIEGLKKYGIEYIEQESTPVFSNPHNQRYLSAKKDKLNHLL